MVWYRAALTFAWCNLEEVEGRRDGQRGTKGDIVQCTRSKPGTSSLSCRCITGTASIHKTSHLKFADCVKLFCSVWHCTDAGGVSTVQSIFLFFLYSSRSTSVLVRRPMFPSRSTIGSGILLPGTNSRAHEHPSFAASPFHLVSSVSVMHASQNGISYKVKKKKGDRGQRFERATSHPSIHSSLPIRKRPLKLQQKNKEIIYDD